MAKELRPRNEDIACDICGRSILKGERIEPYLAPGGQRHVVCELCTDRAYNEGWIREAAHDEMPATTRRPDQRRGILGKLRRRRGAEGEPGVLEETEAPLGAEGGGAPGGAGGPRGRSLSPSSRSPRPPRSHGRRRRASAGATRAMFARCR